MSDMSDFNENVIKEFRANDGKVGGQFEGAPLLLLHSIGAKSGAERNHAGDETAERCAEDQDAHHERRFEAFTEADEHARKHWSALRSSDGRPDGFR